MFTLVKFYDGVHYVCPSKSVYPTKSGIKVKYSDGYRYSATVLVKNDNKSLLETLATNIDKNIPYVKINSAKKTDIKTRETNIEKIFSIISNETAISMRICDYEKNVDESSSNDFNTITNVYNIIKSEENIDTEGHVELSSTFNHRNIDTDGYVKLSPNFNHGNIDTEGYMRLSPNYFNTITNVCNVMKSEENVDTEGHVELSSTFNYRNIDTEGYVKLSPNFNHGNIDTEGYMGLSPNFNHENIIEGYDGFSPNSVVHDGCEFTTLDKCVKQFTFSLTANDTEDKDSEYVPSEQSSSSLTHYESTRNHVQSVNKSISSLDTSNIVGTAICNDEVMYVETSNIKTTKQNYCIFCKKLQSQLARHLETVHRNEPEVKKFVVLPKRHPERLKIIETIRKSGNFKFNTQSALNTGKLIVSRRPNKKYNKTAIDFIACAKCKGFFAKRTIRHHSRVCFDKNFRQNKNIMIMGRRITGRLHPLANETLRNIVFPVMRDDEVTRIIRYDELLIIYGNKMCEKYRAQHQHDMIRARLRLLGRFFLALKNINTNIQDFQSLYHPRLYDNCISAINIIAGYDNDTQLYKIPAVAYNLSTLLKYIGNILIIECIKTEDEAKKKLVKDFIKLLIVDIGTSVHTTVKETQSTHKRHKKINLPSLNDIKKLHIHLTNRRTAAYVALKESFSYEKWLALSEVTLTSILVFNRCRAGQMERAEIQDFKHYDKVNKNMFGDIYKSLSVEDRKIAGKYVRFCIRGKLGRTVPVLLSNEMFDCITLILKFRTEANVPKKNPFIFGLPGVDKNRYRYLKACILMRKFARECNASESTTLRGTTLRKHIATYCIQFNLNDIEVLDFATFMGHADKIHKEHYRQPQASRDILKISQYLEAVQGNKHDLKNESDSDSDKESTSNQDIDSNEENTSNQNILNTTDEIDIARYNSSSDSLKCHKETDKQAGKRKRNTSPYGRTKRVRWTEDEKQAAFRAFGQHFENHTLPSLKEIQEEKKKYSSLARRTLPQIKTWLHNQQKKQR